MKTVRHGEGVSDYYKIGVKSPDASSEMREKFPLLFQKTALEPFPQPSRSHCPLYTFLWMSGYVMQSLPALAVTGTER